MTKISFLPTAESEKRQWLAHFQTNLSRFANALNIDPADVQSLNDELSKSVENIDNVYTKNTELDEVIEVRNEHRNFFFPQLSEFIRRAKISKHYSKALGESMGIENYVSIKSEKTVANSSKLKVAISVSVQKVEFNFKRPNGHAIRIFCRRANEADFSLLSVSTIAEYVDTRANVQNAVAEKREYYFVLTKKDKESDRSNIYAVAVLM